MCSQNFEQMWCCPALNNSMLLKGELPLRSNHQIASPKKTSKSDFLGVHKCS